MGGSGLQKADQNLRPEVGQPPLSGKERKRKLLIKTTPRFGGSLRTFSSLISVSLGNRQVHLLRKRREVGEPWVRRMRKN